MAGVLAWVTFLLVFVFTVREGNPVTLEIGQSTSLQCTFLNDVTSITWQLLVNSTAINISICKSGETACNNTMSPLYEGFIPNSTNSKVFGLTVAGVRRNETQFTCLADTGQRSNVSLDVYAWPQKPVCEQQVQNSFINYTCRTDNVYPDIRAVMVRREINASTGDNDPVTLGCTLGMIGSGSQGDRSASCSWMIIFNKTVHEIQAYVQMSAFISNETKINVTATTSDDIVTRLRFPEVAFLNDECPLGSDVRGNSIRIHTMATCRCQLTSSGQPPGYARWFTKNNKSVGFDDPFDFSATLTYSYLTTVDDVFYECRPQSSLQGKGVSVMFTPTFYGNAQQCAIRGIQSILIVLGVLCSWSMSRFS